MRGLLTATVMSTVALLLTSCAQEVDLELVIKGSVADPSGLICVRNLTGRECSRITLSIHSPVRGGTLSVTGRDVAPHGEVCCSMAVLYKGIEQAWDSGWSYSPSGPHHSRPFVDRICAKGCGGRRCWDEEWYRSFAPP